VGAAGRAILTPDFSFFRTATCLFIIISRLKRGHCIMWMIPPLPYIHGRGQGSWILHYVLYVNCKWDPGNVSRCKPLHRHTILLCCHSSSWWNIMSYIRCICVCD
jgi:hypothetical protein